MYEVLKNFELGGGIRYITRNDDVGNKQGLESFFRYQFDASYKLHPLVGVVIDKLNPWIKTQPSNISI